MIAILIFLGLLAIVLSIASNSSKNRESMQKMERAMAAQLLPPPGFDDCSAEMIAAVRAGNSLGAIRTYAMNLGGAKNPGSLEKAKARVEQLRDALMRGPELGRPPASVMDHLQGKVGP